ncbi:hypothetical protein AG1IA_10432 [Rhizoctonia solani AG-1 IA]|uniref:Uncharacterized protein n=1 Tax=Thanatephorus cucumeris (strain AG1-IA) TaxID=983506 RepID=L8WFH6_THACA|nr:hypothetical protein AG1IA_10432 [Rhizoctonia solani AG-1 IA]
MSYLQPERERKPDSDCCGSSREQCCARIGCRDHPYEAFTIYRVWILPLQWFVQTFQG